ncbi:aromatic amino acid ammonia-lyase [Microbacter sp. GSS18]|nr:aromatic amino acid ammonia-lyase [Microbacter sp. GSS18]
MPADTITLSTARPLALDELQAVAREGAPVGLADDARARIAQGRAVLQDALDAGTRVYGLNTGLGHMRDEVIPTEVLLAYQPMIVTGHAAGVGMALGDAEVRAMMLARAAGAVRGYSGLSVATVERYLELLNAGIVPLVPAVGSIGASDLSHLAAIGQTLIGLGEARYAGERMPAADALARAGLEPLVLGPKEGLAVVSENAYAIGVGALALGEIARVLRLADVAAALTMEATGANLSPLDPEAAVARRFAGQADVARAILALLEGSHLTEPGAAVSLQDPLSVRTVAQVHGAALRTFRDLAAVVETELNSADDNPLTSPDTGRAISTGNFHPMELALGFEGMRVALAHLALTSERRGSAMATRLWESLPDPAELWRSAGIGGYAYAATLARIRTLAGPITLNIPALDNGQEDHATGAPLAVDLTREVTGLLEQMYVGEIATATVLLSRSGHRALGRGTGPFAELVREGMATRGRDESGADLLDRVGRRISARVSARIAPDQS